MTTEPSDEQPTTSPTPPVDPAQGGSTGSPEQAQASQVEQPNPDQGEQPRAGESEQAGQPKDGRWARPVFTITEAAQRTNVSRSTIRRKRETGGFPNAFKRENEWVIPVEDLIGAGLKVRAPGGEQPKDEPVSQPTPAPREQPAQRPVSTLLSEPAQGVSEQVQQLLDANAKLKVELEVERAQRRAHEQVALERERGLNDLRMALRMLEAGPSARARQSEWGSGPTQSAAVDEAGATSVGAQWVGPPEEKQGGHDGGVRGRASASAGAEPRRSDQQEQAVEPEVPQVPVARPRRSFKEWLSGR